MQGLHYAEARERLLHRNELLFVQCLCCRIALCFSSPPEAKTERKALWEDENESRSPLR